MRYREIYCVTVEYQDVEELMVSDIEQIIYNGIKTEKFVNYDGVLKITDIQCYGSQEV